MGARLRLVCRSLAQALLLTAGIVSADGHEGLPHAFDAGWQGEATCELLFEDKSVRVGKCVFPPGIGHEKHYHNPHFGYTLKGSTLRITDANGTADRVIVDGYAWSTDTLTIHEAINVGDSTTSYLIVEPKPGASAE
ncbi:MAG: hypothetical protein R3212_11505 [Xanthomonadales bacterium]|nr:hypothetical protein [Xanthomonadales bacterium]